jgi:hypothetical protein
VNQLNLELRALQLSSASGHDALAAKFQKLETDHNLAESRAEAQSNLASALKEKVQQLLKDIKSASDALAETESKAQRHAVALEEVMRAHGSIR